MVRTRSSNGQFVSDKAEKSLWNLCKIILLLVIAVPFIYHLLVRKEIVSKGLNYLNDEFGCTCNSSIASDTTKGDSRRNGGL